MKKQRSNNKFLKIAAVSLALLALPPLAVYGQTVRCRAAQPRPALPGVMSDEIRLDPVAGALYRYGVQGGINRADSYWSDNVFTVLRGKLKQAAARGLLSREQLDCLLDRVAEGEAHAGPVQPENGSVQVQCYGCSYTGNIQTVSFRMYTVNAYKVTESGELYSIDDETSIELMYLPGNGAFLQVSVLDNRLPAAESTPEEQVQAFLTQLTQRWTAAGSRPPRRTGWNISIPPVCCGSCAMPRTRSISLCVSRWTRTSTAAWTR